MVANTIPSCHALRELLERLPGVVGGRKAGNRAVLWLFTQQKWPQPQISTLPIPVQNQSESTDISSSDNAKFDALPNALMVLTDSCPSSRSSLPGTDLRALPASAQAGSRGGESRRCLGAQPGSSVWLRGAGSWPAQGLTRQRRLIPHGCHRATAAPHVQQWYHSPVWEKEISCMSERAVFPETQVP